MMGIVIVSSVQLAIDSPLNNPDSYVSLILFVMDYIFTAIFTIEVIAKVIAYGLIFTG
jgi:hypothetical protein